MSAENAPSTPTPTLTAEQRVQREQMLMNGIGGDDSQDRAESVMNYTATSPELKTGDAPLTGAEQDAAKMLQKFDEASQDFEEPSQAAELAAEDEHVRTEREKAVDEAHSAAQKAARRALDTVAGSSGNWMNADLDQHELDKRQAVIAGYHASRR